MPFDRLHHTLDELHQQLETAQTLDDEAKAHLRASMDEIRAALDPPRSGSPAAPTPSEGLITERLRELLDHFEDDHPKLSVRLSNLIDSLRKIGF